MSNNLTVEEKALLKARGIIAQKQDGYFTIRFLSKVGYFKANEMIELANLSEEYGNGELSLTSRLTLEIPYIKAKDIEKVIKEAKEKKLRIGGGGPSVRAVIACKGSVCTHGLIDTNKLAIEIEDRFFGRILPGKFKIGVFGCVNSYGKAQSNDLSILPVRNLSNLEVEYMIFLGGRLGRQARLALPMKRRFKENELIEVVEKVISYYEKNASTKERFAEVIDRIGLAKVESEIIK
ncbi:nitrite reductase [Clostridium sardiniense]|uniref:nitrite reductase n=1 Tax=Clostridium sardiniense TaxID=29369 RepID=UPI003D354539